MTGFSWTSVAAALLLFAGDCFGAVDQNKLAKIVDEVWEKYKGKHMFSMAVSIPEKENMDQDYDINRIFNTVNGEEVKTKIQKGDVYQEGRMVAAEFLKKKGKTGDDVHAEFRVLQNFDTLLNQNYDYDRDLLLFYVLGSPCYQKCTNENDPDNILQYLNKIKKWKHYAFVFTYIFKSKNPQKSTNEDQLKEALENLGIKGGLGLKNIFRCAKSGDHMQCASCSGANAVARHCFSDTEPGQDNPPTPLILPPQGRSDSPSRRSPEGGVSNPADRSTEGGQGGSGPGVDSSNKGGRRRRTRRKKNKNDNKGEGGSSSQTGPEVSNRKADWSGGQGVAGRDEARKVGGRRVGTKGKGGGNKQKKKQPQTKKETQAKKKKTKQSRGETQGRAEKQGEKSQKSQRPQRKMETQRGGDTKRTNQPQEGRRQRKGKKPKKG